MQSAAARSRRPARLPSIILLRRKSRQPGSQSRHAPTRCERPDEIKLDRGQNYGWSKPFVQGVVHRWRRLFREHPREPLPREALVGAVVLSTVTAVGGTIWAGKEFWVNVLASLVLLGPGLVITNYVAINWRDRRDKAVVTSQLAGPSQAIDLVIRQIYVDAMIGLFKQVYPDAEPPASVQPAWATPAKAMSELIQQLATVRAAFDSVSISDMGTLTNTAITTSVRDVIRILQQQLVEMEPFMNTAPATLRMQDLDSALSHLDVLILEGLFQPGLGELDTVTPAIVKQAVRVGDAISQVLYQLFVQLL